jgi:hypothetical protein
VGCVERSAWSGTTTGGHKWPNIFLYFLSFIGPREMHGLFWREKVSLFSGLWLFLWPR